MRSRLPYAALLLGTLVLTGCSGSARTPTAAASDLCDQVRQEAKKASNSSQELLSQLRSRVRAADPGSTYSGPDLIAGRFPGSAAAPLVTLRGQLSLAVRSEMTTIVGQPQCFGSGELTMARRALATGGTG